MAEYFEREALLEALENADPDVYEDYGDGTVDWGFGRKNIQDMINGITAADVVPVVHGQWDEVDWVEMDDGGHELIKTPNAGLRCSNCRHCFNAKTLWKCNYCPNCGAKMDGGADHGKE